MFKKLFLLIIGFLIAYTVTFAQSSEQVQKATLIKKPQKVHVIPSLAEQMKAGSFVPAEKIVKEVNPKQRGINQVVPGKGYPKNGDPLLKQLKYSNKFDTREPLLTFEATSAYVTPTDPTGAVGPNHFVNAWNSSFRIWDKAGNPLTSAASLANIFPGNSMGDPIVMYDQFADRFLVTQFYSNGFLVAITQGPDPVNDGWYTYQYATNTFPDYPKYSIWSDGYYITANKNSSTAGTSEVVFALDRDKIIQGDPDAEMVGFPLPTINTNGFFSPLGFNVTGTELPPAGGAPIVYMQDDSWSGVSEDHLKIWSIDVDWDTPSNSTISDPQEITTTPYDGLFDGGSFSNLPQPSGSDIDALQATIMYMAQYRRFPTHNSVVFNFVVDLDGNDDYSGIRWYELRQDTDGDPWTIYQEGTYAQPDGNSAFSGNMAMDAQGNIALAYTIVSDTTYPSLRYTGRFASDPLNVMTLEEETIGNGTQSNPSFRYGDYSQMTIDPDDDLTFWSIGEFFKNGARKNQVGVFKIAPDFAKDLGIVSIDAPQGLQMGSSEPVTVSVRNYGTEAQVDVPVSYQVNNQPVVNETIADTIAAGEVMQYTFQVTADFSMTDTTYMLKAFTGLPTDENLSNDSLMVTLSPLDAHDLGMEAILSPVSGSGLSNEETISVSIRNFGAEPQVDYDISYTLNNNPAVTETIADSLYSGTSYTYDFMELADFSAIQDHNLTVQTELSGDQELINDSLSVTIANSFCEPQSNCSDGHGILNFELGSINHTSICSETGYMDYTALMTDLYIEEQQTMMVKTGHGDVYLKVWIDYNDNFYFEDDEVVINNQVLASGQGPGEYAETFTFNFPDDAVTGEHLMRVKTNGDGLVPELACESTTLGETEDYKVNLKSTTGIENPLAENELRIKNLGSNQFKAVLESIHNEPLIVTLHDINGRTLIYNRVFPTNGQYVYEFNMDYSPKGIYLLRFGNAKWGRVQKISIQ